MPPIVVTSCLLQPPAWQVSLIRKRNGTEGEAAEFLVRQLSSGDHFPIEIRVAVCGNVDSGKSTLVSCLTRGITDNGRGSARSAVFRHRHEVLFVPAIPLSAPEWAVVCGRAYRTVLRYTNTYYIPSPVTLILPLCTTCLVRWRAVVPLQSRLRSWDSMQSQSLWHRER